MNTDANERAVEAFLQPLRGIEPVSRRPHVEGKRWRAAHVAEAAIALGVIALMVIAVIALLAHRSAEPPAHRGHQRTPANVFTRTRGWITFGDAHILAIDPAHPSRARVLSHQGGLPLAWSIDGSKLLVQGSGGLYVLRSDGREVRIVRTTYLMGGSFTPDAKQVVYGGPRGIYEVSVTGGTPRLIVANTKKASYALPGLRGGQLSPDGTTLAFVLVAHHHFGSGIWLMQIDGTRQRQIVRSSEIAALSGKFDLPEVFPVGWSPDGTRLAFIAGDSNGDHAAVFIVNADGTGLRRLTSPANDAETAAWSPDGTQIATRIVGRLLIVNADGPRNPTYSGLGRNVGPILVWNPAH